MKKAPIWAIRLAGPSLLFLGAGCAGADGRDTDPALVSDDGVTTQGSELTSPRAYWWWHHRPAPHGTGGSTAAGAPGSGGTAGGGETPPAGTGGTTSGGSSSSSASCDICTKANICCETVNAGPLCTYDAATCRSLEPTAQKAYVGACGTLLDTVQRARTVLPASCR